jgi:hypothetical protein
MLDLFDVPLMEVNCPERPSSIVPLQALALLHGPFAEGAAAALAERLVRQAPASDAARIELAWLLVYNREPKPAEKQAIADFLAAISRETPDERACWTQAALVLLNSNEFLYVH